MYYIMPTIAPRYPSLLHLADAFHHAGEVQRSGLLVPVRILVLSHFGASLQGSSTRLPAWLLVRSRCEWGFRAGAS